MLLKIVACKSCDFMPIKFQDYLISTFLFALCLSREYKRYQRVSFEIHSNLIKTNSIYIFITFHLQWQISSVLSWVYYACPKTVLFDKNHVKCVIQFHPSFIHGY